MPCCRQQEEVRDEIPESPSRVEDAEVEVLLESCRGGGESDRIGLEFYGRRKNRAV